MVAGDPRLVANGINPVTGAIVWESGAPNDSGADDFSTQQRTYLSGTFVQSADGSAFTWNGSPVSLGGGGGGVTTYASGLPLTVGQLVAHQGITYRVTANHTSGALPDMTKMVSADNAPAVFYPESYGAIGDGTVHPLSEVYGSLGAAQAVYPFAQALTDTLDQCGIQAAINAAVSAKSGVVQLARKTYVVDGSFRTAQGGRALLAIPNVAIGAANYASVEIRGVANWEGTSIKTTLTGLSPVSSRIPCVIGGPSTEAVAGFTYVTVTLRGITIQVPSNPTLMGVDFGQVVNAEIHDVTVSSADTNIKATNINGVGVRMPGIRNYGISRIGKLGVFGMYAAMVANTEHLNADDLTFKRNYAGLCPQGWGGWHGMRIGKYFSEHMQYHLAYWNSSTGITSPGAGDNTWLSIDLWDIEDANNGSSTYATLAHILDANGTFFGRAQYLRSQESAPSGVGHGLTVVGATPIELIDLNHPSPRSGVLAVTEHTLASHVTTNSATYANIDATNATVTFVAPPSGKVLVSLEGSIQGGGATTYGWNLRDGSGDIANTKRSVAYNGPSGVILRMHASIRVTGLTPGASYTWKWGHGLDSGTGTSTIYNTAPLVMTVQAI